MALFKLHTLPNLTDYQLKAIKELCTDRPRRSILSGVTGSEKIFTIANVIAQQNKPVFILAPNNAVALQLYEEFCNYFPENKVCYFASDYDYYQPESYIPEEDKHIRRKIKINKVKSETIEQINIQAITSIFTQRDAIIVASFSCLYSSPNPKHYLDLENVPYLPIERQFSREYARHAMGPIRDELEEWMPHIANPIHRERLRRRVSGDCHMLEWEGDCSNIENYTVHFSGRKRDGSLYSLLDFFPDDFLLIIYESHMFISQLQNMYVEELARKTVLVDFGFLLPSAKDHRPLTLEEIEGHFKDVIFVSETPGEYEWQHSDQIVEQAICPTEVVDSTIDDHEKSEVAKKTLELEQKISEAAERLDFKRVNELRAKWHQLNSEDF